MIALEKVKQIAEEARGADFDSAPPDEGWKQIAGFFGFPVEFEAPGGPKILGNVATFRYFRSRQTICFQGLGDFRAYKAAPVLDRKLTFRGSRLRFSRPRGAGSLTG
jgi:hypothetical protein